MDLLPCTFMDGTKDLQEGIHTSVGIGMRLLSRQIRGKEGSVKLLPVEGEDLWHTYNLLQVGDHITAATFRKVQRTTASGAGESERVKLRLRVKVEQVDFDGVGLTIRIKGTNTTENEHIKLGQYHTIELELNRAFTLEKAEWDAVHLDIIKEACDFATTADLAAVVMQEGLAHVCLVGGSITMVKAKIEKSLPKKRGAAAQGYEKALHAFFAQIYQALVSHVNFEVVKTLIIASPGFLKDQFHEWMLKEVENNDQGNFRKNKDRIVLAHSSSGFKGALKEVLASPKFQAILKDVKAVREVQTLDQFYEMLATESAKAFYGPGHVLAAHERLAIKKLLITDALFRSSDIATRRKYVELVESVKQNGGEVFVFSTMHVSGEQLQKLSGIAAVLRFPLPDLEDEEL
eukprot:scaffold718_cov342-Pavlova_lutheri.AAC.41